MKHLFLIINLFFLSNFISAQNFGAKVIYSLNFEDDEKFNKGEFADFFKQAKDNAKYVNFILEFNKNEMVFYNEETAIDGINTGFSVAFSNSNGLFYKNNEKKEILHSIDDPLLGKIILKDTSNCEWVFHNETKLIQNFECNKATTTIKFSNAAGNFQREIIAWYCPKLPYSFGPKGFLLPGLILELQDKNVIFGAKKIIFATEEKDILEPTGKYYTEKEYSKLLEKHFKDEK